MRTQVGILVGLLIATTGADGAEPLDAEAALIATINKGKSCNVASFDKDRIDCSYTLGSELVIEVAGVGLKNASIAFPKVNEKRGLPAFLAKIGLYDGCIQVNFYPGVGKLPSTAFISPKDGKVYRSAGPWCSWFAALQAWP